MFVDLRATFFSICMFEFNEMKAWDPTDSALAAINVSRCNITPSNDSALAAGNPQQLAVRGVTPAAVCVICNQPLCPKVMDKTGSMHQNCATLKKGRVFKCGMCGEDILHTGNDKVHENCRYIRAEMGEAEAKRYLHDAVAKRGQKREGNPMQFVSGRLPPYKIAKSDDNRPPLPPPWQVPEADYDETDEDMPLLASPRDKRLMGSPMQRSTALAELLVLPGDRVVDPDIDGGCHLVKPSNPRPWKLLPPTRVPPTSRDMRCKQLSMNIARAGWTCGPID